MINAEKGDCMCQKKLIRKKYLEIRSKINQEKHLLISKKIKERFFSLQVLDFKKNILLYHSFRNEIITIDIIKELLQMEKNVFLPYINSKKTEIEISQIKNLDKDLRSGVWGIKEPLKKENKPIDKIDIIVVPALVFSHDGFRIGYGGGYYDKLLARKSSKTISIGLAFNDFLHKELPIDDYDQPVDIIITELETLYIGRGINEFI